MPAWNVLFFCFRETGLFSQQFVGVSIMPPCVGCSVRILSASLVMIFRNYRFYYSVFGIARKCFLFSVKSLKRTVKTTCVFWWDMGWSILLLHGVLGTGWVNCPVGVLFGFLCMVFKRF